MTSHKRKYAIYKCNQRERSCLTKDVNASYLEEYVLTIFNNVLFDDYNAQKLINLTKAAYMRAFDKMQTEDLELQTEIKKKEQIIKENELKALQEEMKSFSKYIEEENSKISWEIGELKHKQDLIKERIRTFPEFKPKKITQKAKAYVERLQSEIIEEKKEAIGELVRIITMDNDNIKITINLQRLLDGIEPILITIIEKRDYIARKENHSRQTLTFTQLSVQL